jgi:hypothetical protein
MGFFSRLFGMPSFAGSTNALLVELTLPTFTDPQRAELKVRVIEFLQNTSSPGMSPETALAELNHASRITQLNLLALAMKELGYKPAITMEHLMGSGLSIKHARCYILPPWPVRCALNTQVPSTMSPVAAMPDRTLLWMIGTAPCSLSGWPTSSIASAGAATPSA